ncbi:MAG: hypothetical protein IJU84_08435 [Clostridia bacterium]|nr:hypothetical protein [Clostridia bacterium]
MKKASYKLKITFIFAFAFALSLAMGVSFANVTASAETDLRGWRVSSPNGMINFDKTGVLISDPLTEDNNGISENYIRAEYIYPSDMENGLEFAYMLPDDESFSVGEEVYVFENPHGATVLDKGAVINDARFYNHSYVKFTVTDGNGNGFEATFYHQYSDDNANYPNRIFVNLCYLGQSIKADGSDGKENGRHYVETVYSYKTNFGVWHTLSCCKENGWYMIAADGTNFVPVAQYGSFDLSAAKVAVEAKAIAVPDMNVALKTPERSYEKSVYGPWMTLGESKVERDFDGTYRFEVDEHNDLLPWTAAYTGNMLMRERVFSTKGYSVDEPIIIDCCLDGNGPQNYLAIKLGRTPLDGLTPIRYEKMGGGASVIESPFEDEGQLAYSESGSCVFVGKLAVSARIEIDDFGMTDYYVAWNAVPKNREVYDGVSTLDRISFIVNDNGTDVYFNDIYVYTFRSMKRSFFEQSGYMAYPYICFSEIPRQPDKNNVLHLRGVNAPYDSGLPVKKYKLSEGDFNISLENYGENISLFYDKDMKQAVNAADYSYSEGILTLKRSFFTGKTYGLNEIFASSENGAQFIRVRYYPDNYVENLPTVVASQRDDLGIPTVVFDRKTVTGYKVENRTVSDIETADNASDLRIKLSLFYDKFSTVYGWGITDKDYMYNERQGTLLIRNGFLQSHENGVYGLVLVTKDEDGITREAKFNVKIVNYSSFEVTVTENVKGCGGAAEGNAFIVAATLFALAAITIKTRKSKKII